MKRKFILLFVFLFTMLTMVGGHATDYSFLDDMTLTELQALRTVLDAKISSVQTATNTNKKNLGMWSIRYYVDDFDQPTSEGYITNTFKISGTFCNSAVEDRNLSAEWAIDCDDVTLFLYEYGNDLVKGYSGSSTSYNVTMRTSSGTDVKLTATLYANGDRLVFSTSSAQKIRDAFSENGKVSFYIVNNRRKVETYLFTMANTSYFANAWNLLNNPIDGTPKTLKQGDSGNDVLKMKTRMQQLGYFSSTASLSDKFTSTTTDRVKLFQKANGLKQTGIADANTLKMLYSDQAKKNPY